MFVTPILAKLGWYISNKIIRITGKWHSRVMLEERSQSCDITSRSCSTDCRDQRRGSYPAFPDEQKKTGIRESWGQPSYRLRVLRPTHCQSHQNDLEMTTPPVRTFPQDRKIFLLSRSSHQEFAILGGGERKDTWFTRRYRRPVSVLHCAIHLRLQMIESMDYVEPCQAVPFGSGIPW